MCAAIAWQARPNATLFRRSWDLFRTLLPRKCSAMRARKIFICCRNKAGVLLPQCRVPHATTDLMMSRVRTQIWPVTSSSSARAASTGGTSLSMVSRRDGAPVDAQPIATIRCLAGMEDLTTPRLVPADSRSTSLQDVFKLALTDLRLCWGKWRLLSRTLGCQRCGTVRHDICCNRDGNDLVCARRGASGVREAARAAGFYAPSRIAYHLFDSFQREAFRAQLRIETSNLTAAPLYRRALGLSVE